MKKIVLAVLAATMLCAASGCVLLDEDFWDDSYDSTYDSPSGDDYDDCDC